MILNCDQLTAVTRGALRIEENNGSYTFHRFTVAQEEFYKRTRSEFYKKALSPASVRLDFTTDASEISFDYSVKVSASRTWFYFDVYKDGLLVCHEGYEGETCKEAKLNVALGKGTKRVEIYFPALFRVKISNVELKNCTLLTPTEHSDRVALIYGDSITQGYDAKYPALSYANIMASSLGFEPVNQAIGGEDFNAGLLDGAPNIFPELITVAYGTNDWVHRTKAKTEAEASEFFNKLKKRYPCAKIVYISPIWRADKDKSDAPGGAFDTFIAAIENLAAAHGAEVIHGSDLFPMDKGMFSDGFLHPNDLGFTQYASRLLAKMRDRGIS